MRFVVKMVLGKILGQNHPFLVQLSVTNRCNCRCRYCYADYYNRPTEDLPLGEIKSLLDTLKKRGAFRINLVGGEPMLRSDISEIIRHVKRRQMHCAMTTNGYHVAERIGELAGINLICFSIDGRPENNDENRGKGAYKRSLAGLEACQDAGIPVQISSVLTRQTVHDVDYLVALAEKYTCKVGFATMIGKKEKCAKNTLFHPSESETRKALSRIIELKKQKKPILFSRKIYEYAHQWPDYNKGLIFKEDTLPEIIKCYAGKKFCIIDYNGDVYPCPQLVGHYNPMNAIHDGLDKALKKASRHECMACPVPCSNEFSAFFGFVPEVLIDSFRTYSGKK